MGQDVYIYGIRTYQTYLYTYIYRQFSVFTTSVGLAALAPNTAASYSYFLQFLTISCGTEFTCVPWSIRNLLCRAQARPSTTIMFLSVCVTVSLGRRLVPWTIINNLSPAWSSGISGDGKQVYCKSWPKASQQTALCAWDSSPHLPSAADESWYWPKSVLCSLHLYLPFLKGDLFQWLFMHMLTQYRYKITDIHIFHSVMV